MESAFRTLKITIRTTKVLTFHTKMVNSFKTSSAFVVVAVILSKPMVGWCQICGKTPYEGTVKSDVGSLKIAFLKNATTYDLKTPILVWVW